nr:mediator of rna polymerase ii transcription subunit 21 [Quercus suber]
MADRLTQLQDCTDDLFTLFYAAVSYIQTRHPYGKIPGQPDQAPKSETPGTNGNSQSQPSTQSKEQPSTPAPEAPDTFKVQLREFARDIVLKEQQMEHIINTLPGLTNTLSQYRRQICLDPCVTRSTELHIHCRHATPAACEIDITTLSKYVLVLQFDMEPTTLCPLAKLRNHTMSRWKGVNDLRVSAAGSDEKHETLFVLSDTGELHVNHCFFTPPAMLEQQCTAPYEITNALTRSGNGSPTSSPSPEVQTSWSSHSNGREQGTQRLLHSTRVDDDMRDSTLKRSSGFPTLFRKPIDWEEESLLLEQQDVTNASALPAPVSPSELCTETNVAQPVRSPSPEHTKLCTSHNYFSHSMPETECEVAKFAVEPTSNHDLPGTDEHATGAVIAITPEPLDLRTNSTQQDRSELDTISTSASSAHSPNKRKSTHIPCWPAKKACTTTGTFTQNMVSLQSSQAQRAKEMLKKVAESKLPRHEQEK